MNPASPSWMLIRLALETRTHHAGADADRLTLLNETPTPERYRTFLQTIYGFEARYELALIQTPALAPRFVREHMRLSYLRDDLLALGETADSLAALPRPPIPQFRHAAHALGWVYVVERNTLLHGLVRRHLWRVLPSTISQASSYLSAYMLPGAHYRQLGADLDAVARCAIPSQIVEAAHEAFACQRLWFTRSTRAIELAS